MKTKYPTFSLAQMRALIVGHGTSPVSETDTCEVDKALNIGRFVLCWDGNPVEAVPSVGALVSVIRSRCGKTEYNVRLESGYIAKFENAKLIDAELLPMMVSGGKRLCGVNMTGYYVGYFNYPDGKEYCTLASSRFGDEGTYLFEPDSIAFLSDVKFGITEDDNG
jgi:hypothetical protein